MQYYTSFTKVIGIIVHKEIKFLFFYPMLLALNISHLAPIYNYNAIKNYIRTRTLKFCFVLTMSYNFNSQVHKIRVTFLISYILSLIGTYGSLSSIEVCWKNGKTVEHTLVLSSIMKKIKYWHLLLLNRLLTNRYWKLELLSPLWVPSTFTKLFHKYVKTLWLVRKKACMWKIKNKYTKNCILISQL